MPRKTGEKTHLERVKVGVALKGHLVRDPGAGALVFRFEPHEEHRVESVDDGVADPASFREVGALAADRVVLVRSHPVPLYHNIKPKRTAGHKEVCAPYASHAC